MTKIEALKELLKINLEELCYNTSINGLTIEFKDDEFIILDKDKNVIFKDLLKNYDLDYISQKRFILNVADSVTSFVDVLEDIEDKRRYFEDLIRVDNEYYFDVVGSGDIYESATYIDIDMDNIYENCKEDCIRYCEDFHREIFEDCDEYEDIEDCEEFQKIYGEYCSDCIGDTINYYIEEIKNNFDWKGVRVVLYEDDYMFNVGFYVSAEIHEDETYVCFIDYDGCLEDLENVKEVEELKDLTDYETITLYYSLMDDEKEAEKAVKFIKELIA